MTVFGGYPTQTTLGTCQTPCTLTFRENWPEVFDYRVLVEKKDFVPASLFGDTGTVGPDGKSFHFDLISETQAIEDERRRQSELDEAALQDCRNAAETLSDVSEPRICRRVAPVYPVSVDTDGYCDMQFDVAADGRTENIVALVCSDNRLARSSDRAISKWLYLPAMMDGESQRRDGMKVRISFRYEE